MLRNADSSHIYTAHWTAQLSRDQTELASVHSLYSVNVTQPIRDRENLKGLNVTKDFTSIPPYFPFANLISAERFAKIVWGWVGDDGPFKFFLRNPIFRETK